MSEETPKTQAIKPSGPRDQAIEKCKTKFLEVLRVNGGNVTKALAASGLARKTAYRQFADDQEFASSWIEALDASSDELIAEAQRRGKEGVLEPVFHNGKKVADVRKYSDTLLIFSIKHAEYQKKWRQRIIQTGNIALSVVQNRGSQLGLTAEQIEDLQLAMTQQFTTVMLS